jgi:hypothetical protein
MTKMPSISVPVSIAHKASFIGWVAFTLASPILAGFVAYHSDHRLGLMCFSAMFALLVWSLVLFRRARIFGVIGFVALVVTLWLLIMIPGYVMARKHAMWPTDRSRRTAAPDFRSVLGGNSGQARALHGPCLGRSFTSIVVA